MPAIPIERITDPRISQFGDLRKTRSSARQGLFVAEGEWLLERCMQSGLCMHSVLCEAPRVARVEQLVGSACEVYSLPAAELSQLLGFHFHRGVLACLRRPDRLGEFDALRAQTCQTIVVCPQIGNPVNLGRILRIAVSFGVDAILRSNDGADEFSRQVLRVSMGAALTMPIIRTNDLVNSLRRLRDEFGYQLLATVVDRAATDLRDFQRARRLAIVLGEEACGVPPQLLDEADACVTIPMPGGTDSLNVADAAAIFLYELCHNSSASRINR